MRSFILRKNGILHGASALTITSLTSLYLLVSILRGITHRVIATILSHRCCCGAYPKALHMQCLRIHSENG